jgi:hypothetical protein
MKRHDGARIDEVGVRGSSLWVEADARLTRPADTTATAVNGAIGSAASALFKFTNFFEAPAAQCLLTGMKLVISGTGIAVPASIGIRAHLYSADPSATVLSANADKGVHKTMLAMAGAKLGYVDFTDFKVGGAGSNIMECYGSPVLSPLHLRADDAAADLYAILVAAAVYTPVSGSIHALFASRASL